MARRAYLPFRVRRYVWNLFKESMSKRRTRLHIISCMEESHVTLMRRWHSRGFDADDQGTEDSMAPNTKGSH